MRPTFAAVLLVFFFASTCYAIKVTLFADTDTYLKRARDIVVAECIESPDLRRGLGKARVDVHLTLKGSKPLSPLTVASLYPLEKGRRYLLYSLGGSAHGTDFLATAELSVVPLPSHFRVEELEGKPLKVQVEAVFSARTKEVEGQLKKLIAERKLLERVFPGEARERRE